ncbi:MAG: hypothetical protein AAGF47_01645, partial [Planctomycetota bacterium]
MLLLPVAMGLVWLVYEVFASLNAKPAPDTDYGAQMRALMLEPQVDRDGPGFEGANLDAAWEAFVDTVSDTATSADEVVYEVAKAVVGEDAGLRGYDWSLVYRLHERESDIADGRLIDGLSEAESLAEIRAVHAAMVRELESGSHIALLGPLLEQARSGAPIVRPWPSDSRLIDVDLSDLRRTRHASFFCTSLMFVAAERKDWSTFMDALEVALWLGRVSACDPIFIGYLVGISQHALALERIRVTLIEHDLPADVLAEVARLLDENPLPGFQHAYRGEKIWSLDVVQRAHDSRGRLIVTEVNALSGGGMRGWPRRFGNLASIALPRRAETESLFAVMYDRWIESAERPCFKYKVLLQPATIDYEALMDRNPLLGVMFPAIGMASRSAWQNRHEREGIGAMVAIERYRAERGVLPASLDDLVPAYLEAVPMDVIDGQPLRYRVEADAAASRPGYVLYSIGVD